VRGDADRKGRTPARGALLHARREAARHLSVGPTATVTLRLPHGLHRWLDEYVHRSWPAKVRKQELVTEALKLLYAVRGRPGEPVLETDLLSGEGDDGPARGRR
jgi:hypothetical protein